MLASVQRKRILLIKPSSLGDIVHALPVLDALRRRYPRAMIDWLAATPFVSLLQGHPQLDHVIAFDRKRFGTLVRSPRACGDFLEFLRMLRARRYDTVIDLQGLFRSGLLAWFTAANTRVGFGDAREFAWMFYSRRVRPPKEALHAVDRNCAICRLLDIEDESPAFDLAITESERSRARGLLQRVNVDPDRPFVAMLPGARWDTKRWSPVGFAEVAASVRSAQGVPSVLLGGPDEVEVCCDVQRRCEAPPPTLAGQTTLRELTALLDLAGVVLCHDSGPMHLAAALGRPLVCITGPTDPARTGPFERPGDVVRVPLDCSPCFLRRLSQCGFEHRCMTMLKVEVVARAVADRLANPGSAAEEPRAPVRLADKTPPPLQRRLG